MFMKCKDSKYRIQKGQSCCLRNDTLQTMGVMGISDNADNEMIVLIN